MFLPLLAHGGPGAAWQALVTVIAVLTALLFFLVVLDVAKVREPGDLILPLAGVVVIGSLAPTASDTLSDGIGWAIPLGVVALAGLLWHAFSAEGLTIRSPRTYGVVALAVVGALVLHGPLSRSLHSVALYDPLDKPAVDDAVLAVTAPQEGATVGTPFDLTVEMAGATIGPTGLLAEQAPSDPEELGHVRLLLNGSTILNVEPNEDCTVAAPCTTVTYTLELPVGRHQLFAEFVRWDGITFATPVFDSLAIEVTDG